MRLPADVMTQLMQNMVPAHDRVKHLFANREQTQLLVSVRSASEAEIALHGGIEILDVKDPSRGSLGMASIDVITQIVQLESLKSAGAPLSVALGEVHEWSDLSSVPELPGGIHFAKLGLSQLGVRWDWRQAWQHVRQAFEMRSRSKLQWVAVAYADAGNAGSPTVSDVLDAAISMNCAGLLIDTWMKGPRTLLDEIDVRSLAAIANECHSQGLFLALAGKVTRESLPRLANSRADIVAIRSAACRDCERTSELDAGRISEFRLALRTAYHNRQAFAPE